ncbi:hypothetical protein [Glaciecola sp. 1036]|uniref:hypothetical protein n=1 Tax=Alteromonadaceae TaxID=72275 RepID=UPI003D00B6DF
MKYAMKTPSVIALVIAVLLFASTAANASFMRINGQLMEVLDLEKNGYTSFYDFYDYDTANIYSSNTGLEKVGGTVLFGAEVNNEFAIFGLFSSAESKKGGDISIDFLDESGSIIFTDDPDERGTLSSLYSRSYLWHGFRNDGFIYAGFDNTDVWNVNLSLTNTRNIDTVSFVSFGNGLFDNAVTKDFTDVEGIYEFTQGSRSISGASANEVPAPAIAIMVLVLLGVYFASFRKRTAKLN